MFLTVGLPGMGKSTAARRLEVDHSALRLNKDEWMKALYGRENPGPASDVIEARLIQIGLRAVQVGVNVVIDFGLWSKHERSALRQAATDVGASTVVCFFDLPRDEQRKRLDWRLTEAPQDTWPISNEELDRWAQQFDVPTPGEIDGSEPIEDPPVRFRSWQDWISDRWPPALE